MVTLVGGPAAGREFPTLEGRPDLRFEIPVVTGEGFAIATYSADGEYIGSRDPSPLLPGPKGDGLTCWDELLAEAAGGDVIVARAPEDASVWSRRFDAGFGSAEGDPVLAWSASRVYFPVQYDGAEWFGSAPRDPRPDGQDHVGG